MPKLSALVHTCNDGQRMRSLLKSLSCCDQVLIIDDTPDDSVEKVAREYGASFRKHIPGVTPGAYSMDALNEWILCVLPNESLSQELEASLSAWKEGDPKREEAFSITVREETGDHSADHRAEVRLVNRSCVNWTGNLPPDLDGATILDGPLLRFKTL